MEQLTGQDKEQERNQSTVTHVKDGTGHATQAKPGQPVQQCVRKHVSTACTCGPETAPLPVVVLAAEQEIHHQDRDRRTAHDHQAVADEEKAEHVVHLVEPDAVHDEVKFGEDGGERKHTDDEHAWDWAEVAGTRWDLARYLIRADGCLDSLDLSVTADGGFV